MMSCSTVQAQRSAGLHFQCNLRSHHREDNQAQVPCTDVTGDTIEPLCRIAQHKLLIVLFFFGLLLSFLFKFPRRHIFLLGNTHCTTLTPSTQQGEIPSPRFVKSLGGRAIVQCLIQHGNAFFNMFNHVGENVFMGNNIADLLQCGFIF